MNKKVAIIGAGIAGLTLASLLNTNSDFEFVIYEKEENLKPQILSNLEKFKKSFKN